MRTNTPAILYFGLIAGLFLQGLPAQSQSPVYGCKDAAATNYNPSATVNDGSCVYGTTAYTPPVKVDPISNTLIENSGLQWAGNSLWTFNDGGSSATLYRIDTASNAIWQTVTLGSATNVDWEDIAFDGAYFYIGDFGNNANGARQDLKIYKFPLSAIPDYTTNPSVTIPGGQIEIINFTYADQAQPPVAGTANNTRFDCEAMIVDDGKIHLFSKNWIDLNTTHYVINGTAAGNYVATATETLSTGYLVTAADKAPGTNLVVLTGYQASGSGNHFMHLLSDFSNGLYFNGNKRRIDLPNAAEMGQVEGVAFRNSTYGYLSNEKFERQVAPGFTISVNQKLRTFNTNAFVPSYVLPVTLKLFQAKKAGSENSISWQFSEPVSRLKVEGNTGGGTAFLVLQAYDRSQEGIFLHQPQAATTCYRLSWKEASGANRVSEISCLHSHHPTAFSHLVVRQNGELSFRWQHSISAEGSIRLLAADGRLVAHTVKEAIVPGVNRIQLKKTLAQQALLLVEINVGGEQKTQWIKVQ